MEIVSMTKQNDSCPARGSIFAQRGVQLLSGLQRDLVAVESTSRLYYTRAGIAETIHFEAALFLLACIGGALHGVGMALRKCGGNGKSECESLQRWQWWLGALCDAIGGLLIWPTMPYLSVNVLMPLVTVLHLSSAYVIGCIYFEEKATTISNMGLTFALIGVVGISYSTSSGAAAFSMNSFWRHWMQKGFVIANGVCASTIVIAFFFAHTATFWAALAAYAEALQFISSRACIDTAITGSDELGQSGTLGAILVKSVCMVAILFFQHYGFQSDLSRFCGIYLASATFWSCILGTAFFGDPLDLSMTFLMSAVATLSGIGLLNSDVHSKSADAAEATQALAIEGL